MWWRRKRERDDMRVPEPVRPPRPEPPPFPIADESVRCTDIWMGKRCILEVGHIGSCLFKPPPTFHRPWE